MAGVVKGAQHVSNGIPSVPDPVCVSPTTLYDAFNNPQPEDNSLQDMIESELAYRMSSGAEEDDVSSPSEDPVVLNGVHEFLERERSHCSESASPSISVSCSEEQVAPLCSGDDFDDVLGASEPADSDFSPNIRPEQDADEGTVAEGESLSDMDPERKSLLDLDPLEAELDGSDEPEPVDMEGRPAECEPSDPNDSARPAELRVDAPVNGLDNNECDVANSMSECVAIIESQESWSTVGEALMHQLESPSETETLSETSETKTIKKKKITENGDGTVTKKKSKKNKKSDCEKENISVAMNGHVENGHSNHGSPENQSNGYIDPRDDLSNVNVRELKTAFSGNANHSEKTKESLKEIDHDIIFCGPIQSLKQTYVSEVTKLTNGTESPDRKQKIATGISIRNLRRSFGDLRNLEDAEEAADDLQVEKDIDEESKARSLGDLRRLSRDSTIQPRMPSTIQLKKPIYTGVSVKALKSSFSKFDQLSKKTVLHVRSVDASKVQKQFNDSATASPESQSTCKSCGKQVFVMEQIKAEKAVWHKNCFRCKECCKQLTVDTYSSHEGELYCKPHFRELFKPKAVIEQETEPVRRRRPEMIIRENQPLELPPDVVRASDKPDLGLEELSSLNVKSRFQVFEKSESIDNDVEKSPSTVNVKRSPSILSKLARFQAKGMDIGVTDDSLNGIHYEESSTSSEEEEEEDDQESDVIKSSRKTRERPMSFTKMEDIKCRWESGATQKEERREERKQEIQNIRSRLFMGKQGKMKEMYEQAVKESEQPGQRKGAEVRSEKAKSIKEKFEKGEPLVSADEDDEKDKKNKEDELSVFEAGISKKSRSMFMELDATAAKTQPFTPTKTSNKDESRKTREVLVNRQPSAEVVKSTDALEDVRVETADVSSKFKFFETYKAPETQKKAFRITPPREGQVKLDSPEREIYRDPDLVRADDPITEDGLVNSQTASKMLSIFRQMEEKATKEDLPDGPKPLKRFTPPPDYTKDSGSSEESSEEEDSEEEDETDLAHSGVIRASDKVEDEFLKAAKEAAKAKTLRAKFEHWEEQENNVNTGGGNLNSPLLESEQDSIESTKSLRARFESLKSEAEQPKEKTRPKVNRFVEIQTNCAEFCAACEKKVYPLEKVETGGRVFHKQCFRCLQCCTVLRMETYTLNNGKLYCIPHFKQLFISKGNYDEGFGLDQHKMKWKRESSTNGDIVLTDIQSNGTAQ